MGWETGLPRKTATLCWKTELSENSQSPLCNMFTGGFHPHHNTHAHTTHTTPPPSTLPHLSHLTPHPPLTPHHHVPLRTTLTITKHNITNASTITTNATTTTAAASTSSSRKGVHGRQVERGDHCVRSCGCWVRSIWYWWWVTGDG